MASTLKKAFLEPPALGTVLIDAGFRYEVTASEPHVNRKGEASAVITWRGWCAEDGKPFAFKTGARVYSLARRCKAHNAGWARAVPFRAETVVAPGAGIDPEYLLDELGALRLRCEDMTAEQAIDAMAEAIRGARDAPDEITIEDLMS